MLIHYTLRAIALHWHGDGQWQLGILGLITIVLFQCVRKDSFNNPTWNLKDPSSAVFSTSTGTVLYLYFQYKQMITEELQKSCTWGFCQEYIFVGELFPIVQGHFITGYFGVTGW